MEKIVEVEIEKIVGEEVFVKVGQKGYILKEGDKLCFACLVDELTEAEEEQIDGIVKSFSNMFYDFRRLL